MSTSPRRSRVWMMFATFVLAVALSGCLGGSEDPPATPAAASEDRLALEENAAGTEADAAAAEEVAAPVVTPFQFEGRLANFALACDPVASQQCVDTGTASANRGSVLAFRGTLTGVHVEMEWSAAGPTTEELGLMVMACNDDGCENLQSVTGPSPLMAHLTDLLIEPERVVSVHAFQPQPAATGSAPVVTYVEFDQAFRVVGETTSVEPGSED